ncbi:MAG: hypothetical protein D6702_13125 [Planctomycetota bacterium]|nr:MAG: hypothetical protein D6702_13125 [Planctomycetota bacterium]
MKDAPVPTAHGAWLILATAILLGVLSGEEAGPGTLALSLSAVLGFCAVDRLLVGLKNRERHPAALRLGVVYAVFGFVAGVLAALEVGWLRLLWIGGLAPFLGLAAWALSRSPRHRPAFEGFGMVCLSLVLPAVSLSTGCPVGWPLFTLWAVFALHVLHASLRTRAHLQPRHRRLARWVGVAAGLIVLALVGSGGVSEPIALAVVIGLAEPWSPDWKPLPARRIGWRETALISLFPLALLVERLLG